MNAESPQIPDDTSSEEQTPQYAISGNYLTSGGEEEYPDASQTIRHGNDSKRHFLKREAKTILKRIKDKAKSVKGSIKSLFGKREGQYERLDED